jgi:hypothetical protein
MVSHTDYSEELSDAYPDRGHPLADPQPGFDADDHILPRMEIGDVGYIQCVCSLNVKSFVKIHLIGTIAH